MSSALVESGGNGKYFLSVDFFDHERDYIDSPEEIKERFAASREIYENLREKVKNLPDDKML